MEGISKDGEGAEQHRQMVPTSPSRKRPALDHMLLHHDEPLALEPLEGAPAWATALQRNWGAQLSTKVLIEQEEVGVRVGHLEAKECTDSARIQQLEDKVVALQKSFEDKMGSNSSSGEPTSPPSSFSRLGASLDPRWLEPRYEESPD